MALPELNFSGFTGAYRAGANEHRKNRLMDTGKIVFEVPISENFLGVKTSN